MYILKDLVNNTSVLPQTPGVYLFLDSDQKAIYIGKALNLRNRLRSYLKGDYTGEKTHQMMSQSRFLDLIRVESEFEALLLESKLINKYKPKYNVASRDDKSPLYIFITGETYPRVRTGRLSDLKNIPGKSSVFGPFPNGGSVRSLLRKLRRIFPYCESKGDNGRPCLHSHIGLCNPCPRLIARDDDPQLRQIYLNNIKQLKNLLSGRSSKVLKMLNKDMLKASRQNEFEKAARIRNQIQHVQWLTQPVRNTEEYLTNPNLLEDNEQLSLDSLVINLGLPKPPSRIECYDVSHTGKDQATASMVVAINGRIENKHYRHFKIKMTGIPNDVGAIAETISRRLSHPEWGIPDLIIIDGGKAQLHSAINELQLSKYNPSYLNTVCVSLAKRFEEIFVSGKSAPLRLPDSDPGKKLIIRLRNESHRFARRLHHKLRSKALFK